MPVLRLLIPALVLACALASPAAAQAADLSVSDATVTEGTGTTATASFKVTLSEAPLVEPVTVNYATADGSAKQPGDYTSKSGTLTFLPLGGLEQTVDVPVQGDALDEPNETFKLNLSNPSLGTDITDPQGVGTITDDDSSPVARIDVTPPLAYVGKVVEFNGSRSSDPDGQPLEYTWDLDGNGTFETPTGNESAVGLAFLAPGRQFVGLRVTDPGGNRGDARASADIYPAPPEVTPDTTPPATYLFPGRRSLRRALRRGIRVRFACSEACLIGATAGVNRRTGRRVGLSGRLRTVGWAFSAMPTAGSKVLTFKLRRQARRRLGEVKKVSVNLRFTLRDAAFNVRTVNHKITLRR